MTHTNRYLWTYRSSAVLAVVAVVSLTKTPVVSAQTEPKPNSSAVTFAKNVAPILQAKCQVCHRPGQVAPMSLLSYEETRPWARSIKLRVERREMPPWGLERNIGIQKFKADPSLTDEEIATIAKWVDGGALQGNPADAPPPLKFADNGAASPWSIGTPDLLVTMPAQTIPAIGPDWWPDIVVDSGLTEDRYIQAVETKPTTAASNRVVHHAFQTLQFSDGSGGILNEYALGKNGDIFTEGAARLIKAGTKINFGMHFHSVGEEIKAQVTVAIKFYPKGYQPKYVVTWQEVGNAFDDLDLAPGDPNARTDGYYIIRKPMLLMTYQPHMHNRGKRMCMEAVLPSGQIQPINCAKFDFNWMTAYSYADDVAPLLPPMTILHVTAWHDNSAANRNNPDPRNWVGFGNRSIDDMSFAHLTWMDLSEEDFDQRVAARKAAGKPTF